VVEREDRMRKKEREQTYSIYNRVGTVSRGEEKRKKKKNKKRQLR